MECSVLAAPLGLNMWFRWPMRCTCGVCFLQVSQLQVVAGDHKWDAAGCLLGLQLPPHRLHLVRDGSLLSDKDLEQLCLAGWDVHIFYHGKKPRSTVIYGDFRGAEIKAAPEATLILLEVSIETPRRKIQPDTGKHVWTVCRTLRPGWQSQWSAKDAKAKSLANCFRENAWCNIPTAPNWVNNKQYGAVWCFGGSWEDQRFGRWGLSPHGLGLCCPGFGSSRTHKAVGLGGAVVHPHLQWWVFQYQPGICLLGS